MRSRRTRKSENRVFRKKIVRSNDEFMPHHGHDGPVFGAWHVMKAHCVPRHDVSVVNGAVGLRPSRKAVISLAGRGVNTRGVKLVLTVWRHPELVRGKGADALRPILRIEQ